MNLMLINVSTRKFRRAVRLPAGDVPAPAGSGVSMGGKIVRTIGIARARFKIGMVNLGYNIRRLVQLGRVAAAPACVRSGWSLCRACRRDRAVTRQPSNRPPIKSHLGTSEANARSATQKSPKAGIVRGAQKVLKLPPLLLNLKGLCERPKS
jgi:hypothetical protein